MDTIYGPGEIRVNSSHHQAVDQVAPQFSVSACSPDGVVEAIESIDDSWFCVGVQWHPEYEISDGDRKIFKAMIASAAAS